MNDRRKRIWAILLALLFALCLAVPACASQGALIIFPQELTQLLAQPTEGISFIDLRSEKEYNQMHIPGFELLEYDEQAILALAAEEQPVVFICSKGVRSAMAYNLLLAAGKANVHACIFGVADYAQAVGEAQMEGDNICLPCLLKLEEEAK